MLWRTATLLSILLLAIPCGCLPPQFGGPDATKEKAEGGGRPTDDPEGLEGYLTDPTLVKIEDDTIVGQAGAIGVKPGGENTRTNAAGIVVAAWDIESDQGQKTDNGKWLSQGENIGCGETQEDGSFVLKFTAAKNQLLLTAGIPCDQSEFSVQTTGEETTAFVRDEEQGFTGAEGEFNAGCLCPAGTIFYEGTFECLAPFDECPPEIYPAGKACGCNGVTYDSVCDAIADRVIRYQSGACKDL